MALFDPTLTRRILGLSSPVMMAMLTQTLINQVDHILVGHLPQSESTPGQTALQISVILLWAFGGMLAAISVGTQALTARRIGAGDHEGAGAVSTNSQLLAVVASIIVTAFTYAAAPYLFRLMNKDPAVIALGVPFLRWRFLQITSLVWTASLKAFFDGLGKTRVHMGVAIAMNIANFLMCVAFIYGPDLPGIPVVDGVHHILMSMFGDKLVHMGVPGAGLASMLSSYVGLVLMLGWSLRGEYRKFHTRRISNASLTTVWQIAKLSVPSGIATMFAMGGFGFVLFVVAKLDTLAGHGVGRTIYFDGHFEHHQRASNRVHLVSGVWNGDGNAGEPEHGCQRVRSRRALRVPSRPYRCGVVPGARPDLGGLGRADSALLEPRSRGHYRCCTHPASPRLLLSDDQRCVGFHPSPLRRGQHRVCHGR
jgi:Na+-driven multidrug efflux pump